MGSRPGARAGPSPALALLVACAGAASCGDPAAEARSPAVRDSAGITIVENPAPAADVDAGWVVASEPSLVIGVAEGAAEHQLYQVTAATRLPDGRIAVVNAGTGEVRFYDRAGAFLGAAGGLGEGPGEFREMALVASPADSLLIYDRRAQRFTWVTAEPAIGATFPSSDGAGHRIPVTPHGRLADGRIVASGGAILDGSLATGVRDPLRHLLLLDGEGVARDTLGSFPHEPRHVWIQEHSVSIATVPFGTVTRFAVGTDAVHVGTADAWEIVTYGSDGGVRRLVRLARVLRPVTDEAVESAIRRSEDGSDLPPGRLREQYDLVEMPDSMPAHGRVLLDRGAHLWVEEYRTPGATGPARWLVLDPDGEAVGAVAMPEGLEVHEIGTDYVLGVALDELETERVVMYPLDRGPAS